MLACLLTYAHRSRWSIGHLRPPRHRTLFWAALAIPVQLVPCCFSCASVSRLQLLRGRPRFLFPCGFQVRAWRVVLDAGFRRVCPIQPHFLRSICWFLSRSLPQLFISDLLLPWDFVDAPPPQYQLLSHSYGPTWKKKTGSSNQNLLSKYNLLWCWGIFFLGGGGGSGGGLGEGSWFLFGLVFEDLNYSPRQRSDRIHLTIVCLLFFVLFLFC